MSADQRALWRPFSESPVDAPLPAEGRDRLLPVERVPFLQAPVPVEDDQAQEPAPVSEVGAQRRRLGPGGAAFSADAAAR
ncbi:hypothetical protein ACFV4M_03840 [Kitasatospora indigofera]|uniref:hypothetical protein n=1 Tax=Kitasatospora indigofera TaxID=67307 RepID=UPI00365A808A